MPTSKKELHHTWQTKNTELQSTPSQLTHRVKVPLQTRQSKSREYTRSPSSTILTERVCYFKRSEPLSQPPAPEQCHKASTQEERQAVRIGSSTHLQKTYFIWKRAWGSSSLRTLAKTMAIVVLSNEEEAGSYMKPRSCTQVRCLKEPSKETTQQKAAEVPGIPLKEPVHKFTR